MLFLFSAPGKRVPAVLVSGSDSVPVLTLGHLGSLEGIKMMRCPTPRLRLLVDLTVAFLQ